jgi:hypothetical protein
MAWILLAVSYLPGHPGVVVETVQVAFDTKSECVAAMNVNAADIRRFRFGYELECLPQ